MGLFDRLPWSSRDRDAAAHDDCFRLDVDDDGEAALLLSLGDLPTDSVAQGAGEEPNGAFWEGVAFFLAPALTSRLELDSEGSMFAVYGERADLEALREVLEPLVHEPAQMTNLLARARAEGVVLEGYEG